MQFCSENANDIQRYFKNTFMKFPEMTGECLYFIDQVTTSNLTGKYYEKGETHPFEFKLHPVNVKSPVQVEFILPQKSFFICDERLYFLHRIPARQYHRGVHRENTAIIDVETGSNVGLSFELLEAYVQKQLTGNINKNVSVLQRRIARLNSVIYLDRTQIATILHEGVIKMVEKVFQPEIERIIKPFPGWKIEEEAQKKTPKIRRITKKYGVDEDGQIVTFEAAV